MIVPAARSSATSSSIRPTSGPGGRPSSSPRRSGSAGSFLRRSTAPRARCSRNASASSAHGSVARRKRWIERGEPSGRRGRAQQRVRVAAQLVRDRQPLERRPERGDEQEPRRVDDVAAPRRSAAPPSSAEQAELVQAQPAVERQPLELAEDALAGRPGRRGARAARTRRSLAASSRRPSSSSSRTARSSLSGSSAKIRSETGGACGGRGRRGRRTGRPRPPPATGTAIALTVKSRSAEVGLDRAALERREVARVAALERDAPRAVTLRERERRPAGTARVPARRPGGSGQTTSRSTTGRPSSSSRSAPPTNHASSPRQQLPDQLIHRRRPAARALGPALDPADELVVDRAGDARVGLGEHAVADQRHRRPDRAARGRARRRRRPSRPCRRRGRSSPSTRTSVPVRSRRKPSA